MSKYTYYNQLKEDGILIRDTNKDILDYVNIKDKRLTNLTSKFIASRYSDINKVEAIYDNRLSDIMSKEYISGLPDIKIAAKTIIKHIKTNPTGLIILSDSDADGQTSAVLCKLIFKHIFNINITVIINQKRVDGYGINDTLTEKVIKLHKEKPYSLILTSDHASNDGRNLKKITDATNCDLVVTDHHLFNEDSKPTTQVAFVNPQREECTISKNLSGAHVLYYTLLYTAYEYFNDKIPKSRMNIFYYYLTYVGLTIISDFMKLDDYVNRKIVIKALGIINNDKIKHNAFWTTVKNNVKSNYYITETTLSFEVIPLINSMNRIDNPTKGYECMIEEDKEYCNYLFNNMRNVNDKRKEIQQKGIRSKNITKYETDTISVQIGKDFNNVQGILSSRMLSDYNYMLSIFFVPNEDNTELHGSGRMVDSGGENLKDIITAVKNKSDIVLTFGGHAGAVGMKIKNRPEEFFKLLKEEVENNTNLKRDDRLYVDEVIYSNKKLITTLYDIRNGGPYGSNYVKPSFVSDVFIHSYRVHDKKHNVYLSMMVKLSEQSDHTVNVFYSIPMGIKDDFLNKLRIAKRIRIVYGISINNFMNNNKLSLDAIKIFFK